MYTFPSATINHVVFTAVRWGQFPTITYDTSNVDVTAGNEIVVVASDLSDITIFIEDGASTNTQIAAAIMASDRTVQSLSARNLISVAIAGGHGADVNMAVSATPLADASAIPPPSEPPVPVAGISIVVADPENPSEGQIWYNLTSHVFKFFDGTDVQTIAVV